MKLLVTIVITILLLFSCKKNDDTPEQEEIKSSVTTPPQNPSQFDSICKPLPYFPAFPASFWKYSNGKIMTADSSYQAYLVVDKSDTIKYGLPRIKGGGTILYLSSFDASDVFYIKGYSASTPNFGEVLPFFREKPGKLWTNLIGIDGPLPEIPHSNDIRKGNDVVLNGKTYTDIIVIDSPSPYFQGTPGTYMGLSVYFARDVGPVLRTYMFLNQDFEQENDSIWLVDYQINWP